jgi:PAS domain S-box-containing protein
MSSAALQLTGVERPFFDDEIIVSKTDLSGRITYVNDVFVRVAGYSRAELMGQAHSIIRHPDMPRCVFQLLWDTIQAKRELFAYVVNLAKNGDHYWVFAHVTPTVDARGELVGYHSNRRTIDRRVLPEVEALYARLRAAEQGHRRKRDAVDASLSLFHDMLHRRNQTYEEYVWAL